MQLAEILPAADAAAGEFDQATADMIEPATHIGDLTDSGRADTAEMLRPPSCLDYIRRHGIEAPDGAA